MSASSTFSRPAASARHADVREHRVVRRVGRGRSAGQRVAARSSAGCRSRSPRRARRGRTRTSASSWCSTATDRVEATINTVAVANGRYFGGAMMVAPERRARRRPVRRGRDRRLRVRRSLEERAPAVQGHAPRDGQGDVAARAASSRRSRSIRRRIVELDVDGEALGRLPARFELLPGALWMVRARRRGLPASAARGPRQPRRGAARGAARGVAAGDPFAPATIVVGSHLVARWLTREIALARGIAAGLDLVTFDRVRRARRGRATRRRARPGSRRSIATQLAAAIASVLADDRAACAGCRRSPRISPRRPAPGDRAGPRRVQLAEHLAELVLAVRADAAGLDARAGRRPRAERARRRSDRALAGRADRRGAARLPAAARCAPVADAAVAAPARRAAARRGSPRRSRVFGMSFLAARAARGADRSRGDAPTSRSTCSIRARSCGTTSPGARRARRRPRIRCRSSLWGRPVRDTLGALVERTGGDLDGAFVDGRRRDRARAPARRCRARGAATPELAHAAGQRAGVTRARVPEPAPRARGRSRPRRARRLDADPTLRAHEIAVWIAGDAERYLAQAPSAFEAVGVPCHLIDAPIDDRGRIGEAVLALLELPTSRDDAPRPVARDDAPGGARRRIPHVDADDWVRWTERLGIVHGADARAHAGTYLEDASRPVPLGSGRAPARARRVHGRRARDRGPRGSASSRVAPEEVRPDQQASAATYALLVRSLCADAAWLAALRGAARAVGRLFVGARRRVPRRARDDEAARDLERVRAMLAGIARARSRRPARRISRGARARGRAGSSARARIAASHSRPA